MREVCLIKNSKFEGATAQSTLKFGLADREGELMEYLIKSLKWTKHYKKETWYGHNRNGYTHMICDAGVYTTKDKYEMTYLEADKTILFVPLTQKLINKGKKQLNDRKLALNKELLAAQRRYTNEVNSIHDELRKISDRYKKVEAFQAEKGE